MEALKVTTRPYVNTLEVKMSEEKNFLDRLEYIKSELHFLLDEIVSIEDQVKNPAKNEIEKSMSSDVEMFQDILMAKTLFKKFHTLSTANTDLMESGDLAYGT